MGFKCGIVGLPNVGKSTLFNALSNTAAAEAANYPFCTIEPNVGRVAVPDARLDKLAAIAGSAQVLPAQMEFVDIAGLVKGASKGEGLGNQFLSHIREVDAIVHVLRCFEDDNITHVEGRVNPLADLDIIETELVLADMESLERRLPNMEKKARGDKEVTAQVELIKKILPLLQEGKPVRAYEAKDEEERAQLHRLQMITSKPIMIVCNVDEGSAAIGNQYSAQVEEQCKGTGTPCVVISAQIEAEVAALESEEEKKEFLEAIGLEQTGLSRVIQAGYGLLGLITFFTVGPKEARAWTVRKGAKAPESAGVIHTDFQRGFIKAETISYDDYVALGGEQKAREAGKMRQEGKEYITKDGDVFHFLFNV